VLLLGVGEGMARLMRSVWVCNQVVSSSRRHWWLGSVQFVAWCKNPATGLGLLLLSVSAASLPLVPLLLMITPALFRFHSVEFASLCTTHNIRRGSVVVPLVLQVHASARRQQQMPSQDRRPGVQQSAVSLS
jgi:hypothetical protein